MAYSKIIYGGNVLIDLTGDTVAADKLLAGITAHGKDGEEITGTCAYMTPPPATPLPRRAKSCSARRRM